MLGAGARADVLPAQEVPRLAGQLELAVRRARKDGEPTLATLSLDVDARFDPTAAVCASRRPGESWFVLEQPERNRVAIAGLGEAVRIEGAGAQRFAEITK